MTARLAKTRAAKRVRLAKRGIVGSWRLHLRDLDGDLLPDEATHLLPAKLHSVRSAGHIGWHPEYQVR